MDEDATTMDSRRLRRYLRHGLMPQLAAFDAVMRLGSVTRASEALHMAQPTVSGHLRKLADAVGVPLFRCDGRRMHPTPQARALHRGALDVFAALHNVEVALAPWRDGAAGAAATPVQPAAWPLPYPHEDKPLCEPADRVRSGSVA
jgi:DNA-binding transcriptional LysR family regulator